MTYYYPCTVDKFKLFYIINGITLIKGCEIIKTCCFTGHRELNQIQVESITFTLYRTINDLVERGYTHFISGFADGADLLCAEVVSQFKKINSNISLEAAIPNRDRLNYKSEKFKNLLDKCDNITVLQEKYHKGCFDKRNRYMVDQSDIVVAIWDGRESGGTYNTISYAQSKGKKVIVIKV